MKKLLAAILVLICSTSAFAQLPQNHPWEVTLRNYMASLKTSDFAVTIAPLSFNSNWVSSDDQLYKWWLAFRDLPDDREIQMDPKYLLLTSIEGSDGQIHMKIGRGGYSVLHAAWWADFDYPGNPYYGEKSVKLRALIPAMTDMMMLTKAHEDGKYTRSDFAGGNLMMYAYAFYVGKNVLPDSVQQAYATGMLSMMQDIIKWGPTGIFGDMDGFASVGMWYVANTLNNPAVTKEAENYTDRLIKRWFYNAGYMGHGDGFDATYDGIDLFFYTWTAMISDYQPLINVIDKIVTLKGHLGLPDPDGYSNGPSHFSTATAGPVAMDQWSDYLRDVSDAMISDNGLYLLENYNRGYRGGVIPDESYMMSSSERTGIMRILTYGYSGYRKTSLAPFETLNNTYIPQVWSENHWINDQSAEIYAFDAYKDGFYKKIISLKNNNDPILSLPFQRKSNFIEVFSNNKTYPDSCTFVTAKLGGYGVVIHTGRLSNWGGATGTLSGLSGGALSTFWTPATGTVINGVAGGYQNNNADQHDTWSNWQQWGVNTISGVNGNGDPFSSARNRFPDAVSSKTSNSATVTVEGQIGSNVDAGRTAPNNAIQGSVHYTRQFEINGSGVTITSTLKSDGKDKAKELWEMIPVFLQNNSTSGTSTIINLQISNGKWVSATTTLTKNVTAIQLQRFNGAVNIDFNTPQAVKLSVARTINYQINVSTQNIMIDMLHSGGSAVSLPNETSVTYTIAPTLQKSSTPIEKDSGSKIPNQIELKQNYPNPFNPTTTIGFALNKASIVSLKIFDILGRLVSNPISGKQFSAGQHNIVFDGDNLSSGVYIYRFNAGSQSITKKMMLVK